MYHLPRAGQLTVYLGPHPGVDRSPERESCGYAVLVECRGPEKLVLAMDPERILIGQTVPS